MWTDNETKTDLIGFKVHADLIRSVVTDENLLPVVLGVFGDWGGGKSSIMQMLEHDLNAEENNEEYKDIVCLYFNGWMFEGYEDAKTALLSSILIQLGEHKRFGEKVRDSVVGLLKRVKWMEVLKSGGKAAAKYGPALAVTYLSGGTVPAIIPAAISGLAASKDSSDEKDDKDKKDSDEINWSELIEESKGKTDLLEVRKFREDFEKMLKATNIKSLVILIDDLDRCLPERIIETLEAIKLFVLVPRTAFVIGADPRIVRHAIGTRYVKRQIGDSDASQIEVDDLTKDYLEKLIQIPYHLPRLSPAEIETYINLLACQKFLSEDDLKLILENWSSKRRQNFYSSYQLRAIKEVLGDGQISAELEQQLSWSSSVAQVVTEGLKGNPRQVKRMLNAMLLRKKLADVAGIQIQDAVLAKLMVLEYSHLQRFYELNNWQASEDGHPQSIEKLEKELFDEDAPPIATDDRLSEWRAPSLKKWLQIEPQLKNIDLRDYFWLARDRTSSTLAGVNMVSPLVRRYYNDLMEGNEGNQEIAATQSLSLEQPEREALLGLLQQIVIKHPEQSNGYAALRRLAVKTVENAGQTLLKVVKEVSVDKIPPAVANWIQIIGKADETLTSESRTALEYLSQNNGKTKTRISSAAKAALEGR